MKLPGVIVSVILTAVFIPSAVLAYFGGVHVELSLSADSISAGDPVTIDMKLGAYSTSDVETNAVVTLSLPPGTTDAVSSDCTLTEPLTMRCVLPELAPNEETTISVLAALNREGNNLITASVNTDELVFDARTDSKIVAVVEAPPANESPVDLEIEVTGPAEIVIGRSNIFNVTVKNNHDSNIALYPFAEFILEESFLFWSGDSCAASGQLVTCHFSRLLPGTETSKEITLTTIGFDDDASLTASISSTQPDTVPLNNSAQHSATIVPREILCGGGCQPIVYEYLEGTDNSDSEQTEVEKADIEAATAGPEINTTDSNTNSGGGVFSMQMLLLLLFGWQVVPARIESCCNNK